MDPIYYVDITAAEIALDTAVNIMVTAMISIKILWVSRIVGRSINARKSGAKAYTSIVAIIMESAAPCAVHGILTCVGLFMSGSSTSASGFSSNAITLTWPMSIVIDLFAVLMLKQLRALHRHCSHNLASTASQKEALGQRRLQKN
jgi:hypothetical protein